MQLPKCWNTELTNYIQEQMTIDNKEIREMHTNKWRNAVDAHIEKQLKVTLEKKEKKKKRRIS